MIPWRRKWQPPAHTLQYSCLKNPTDRGSWWATGHGVVPKSRRWLKRLSTLNTSVKDFSSSYIDKNQEWTVNGFLVVYGLKSNFPLLFYTLLNVNLETTHCHPMAWLRMFLFNSGSCSYLEAGHTFPSLSFQYTDESSQRATISLEVKRTNSKRV